MKNSIMTFGHIWSSLLAKQLTAACSFWSSTQSSCSSQQSGHELYQERVPAPPGSCCHCNLSTRLRELWIRPCRLEPRSMVLNSSKGSQQLQPSTSATWRGIKAMAVAGIKAFILPSNAELGIPRSRKSLRKIQGFQYSLAGNKILWVAGAPKQTEITSSHKRKGLFHAVNCAVYLQATVKSSL